MATAAELKAQAKVAREQAELLVDQARELAEEARKAEQRERRARRARENAEHSQRMFVEIGEPLAGLNAEQHAVVYEKAWDQGHSGDYSEVQSYYEDLAELARRVIELQKG